MSIVKTDTKHDPIVNDGPMFNAYPDSIGGSLGDIVKFLQHPELMNAFQSLYILPSVFNSDIDRGYSIIDYDLNEIYAVKADLDALRGMGITLKFDFVLNHISVLSEQFQDVLEKGEDSEYIDFFIDWNKFWTGYGVMTEKGYIQPDSRYIGKMFFRKPGLPILSVIMADGKEVPFWNTFYQEILYEKINALDLMRKLKLQYGTSVRLAEIVNTALDTGKKPSEIDFGSYEQYRQKIIEILEQSRKYLGQMDLNIKSPMVWDYYKKTFEKLAGYGAEIVRLDAFAYTSKEPGASNFFNDPETWDILNRIQLLANKFNLTILPEIHSKYEDKIHEVLAEKGFMTYDFFLPGLIIDALERHTNEHLVKWIKELCDKRIRTVNMLGCHDGIPLLDLKGLIPDDQIMELVKTVVSRGGYVKDLHGKKDIYYQVNAAYFSALGGDERKLVLARAIQIFMPGKPQVWYLDLFGGKNDYEAVRKAGPGGHKEINRTNLTKEEAEKALEKEFVRQQLELLKFRNTFGAFGYDARLSILGSNPWELKLCWEKNGYKATLEANLKDFTFKINRCHG